MASRKGRSSILIDFLISVIIAVTILLALITYFNVIDKKNSVLKEVSNNSKYISISLKEIAKKAIIKNDSKDFEKSLDNILSQAKDRFYEINLYRKIDEKKVAIIFSTNKDNVGKEIEASLKEIFEKETFAEGENIHGGLHTFDFNDAIKADKDIIGTLSIITSLRAIDAENTKMLVINMGVAVFSIIFIVAFTTMMLIKRIYNPINELIAEVKKIKEGEVTYEVSIKVNNELSLLADEINEMKSSLWENNMESRFSNHITGLPTFISAVESITDKLENDEFFGIISISIRNYEPYILGYGFNKWEEVLRYMTQIMEETMSDAKKYQIVQLKENQFMIITVPDKLVDMANVLISKFDSEIRNYYNQEDNNNNHVEIKDMSGNNITYPFMNLFIGFFNNKVRGEITSFKKVEDIILKMETSYYEFKESSHYVSFDEMKKRGDTIIDEVSENVAKNVTQPVKADKSNTTKKKEEKIEETEEDLLEGLELE